ncbi:MAG: alpha/beta fold hydrolase [archaeon]
MISEEFSFQGTGGVKIVGNLTYPKEKRVGTLVLFHHGLWVDAFFPPFQQEIIRALLGLPDTAVASYDARGHGRSCTDSATGEFGDYFDPEQMVPDVSIALNFLVSKLGLVDEAGLKIFLVGHSLGGYVCLRTAAEDKRISGVVAISSPVVFRFEKHATISKFLEKFLVELPQEIHDRSRSKDPISLYKLRARDLVSAERKFISTPPIMDFSEKISCPTTFLIGKGDFLIEIFNTRARTAELSVRLPGARILFVEGEHGFFGFERPLAAAVLKEIEGFSSGKDGKV